LAAVQEAEQFKDEYVSTEHLLLAVAGLSGDPAEQILRRNGASRDAILQSLASVRGTQRVTDPNPEAKYQALERYARDAEVVTRHNQLQAVNYEAVGRTVLGLESNSPLF